ncbi:kinesin-like protein subito [Asbolus verrucosus]|uniref:Kinesin-like protein n=1 Tax=Asbolus verrucosus TaxID=1661398 RepID=A0A482W937_ASBVE|nr:kinesin-like protein subito [Asbolus verrucosus]
MLNINILFKFQSENIRVYLRIKSGYNFSNLYVISNDTLICNVPEGSHCMRNVREGDSLRKIYTFSRIFHPQTTQNEIFNSIVKQKILDFINGENSTLLTYGASGSGKTFTVIGTDEEPGVVPRSLEYLFRTLPQLSKNPVAKPLPAGNITLLNDSDWRKERQFRKNLLNASSSLMDKTQHVKTYMAMQQRLSGEPVGLLEQSSGVSLSIWVSFAEIYNEQIYDLLQPDPPRGKQRPRLRLGCSNGNTYIKNLTNINVTSGLEAYEILQYGIHNLNYASTNLNSHSSRSHSIFTIKLVQVSDTDGGIHISSFNFCDLAGSERTKKTMNVGERLKESNNINSSLLVLGRCISAIRNSQKHNDHKLVPFRESKLTQLFQKALAGQEDIAMIVNISPKREMFDETQHVLNFSAVAKDIAIERRPVENLLAKKPSRFSQLVQSRSGITENGYASEVEDDIEQLRNAVLLLQNELEQQRNEFEINEKLSRDYIIEGYEKILKETEENADRRVKDAEAYVALKYETKLRNMRLKYEAMLEESERNAIIQLDSSDEEEIEQLKEMIDELKNKEVDLQKALTQLKIENETKEQQVKELMERNRKMNEEKMELQRTLDDAVRDYVELQCHYDAKENENLLLEKRNLELENELDSFKEQINAVVEMDFGSEDQDDNVHEEIPREDSTEKDSSSQSAIENVD